MQLTPAQRRFLWLEHGVVGFGINILINGAIGWAMFRSVEAVPLWGQESIGGDTLGTSFFLPAITCLIVTPLVRTAVRKGAAPGFHGVLAGWLRPFQRRLVARALALGLAGIVLAGGIAILALSAAGVESLGFPAFLGWKALYAGVLAAFVQPAIALLALADKPGR